MTEAEGRTPSSGDVPIGSVTCRCGDPRCEVVPAVPPGRGLSSSSARGYERLRTHLPSALWECQDCGAVVVNMSRHTGWHTTRKEHNMSEQPVGPTLPDPETGEPYEVSRDDLEP